ncbi:alanine racemase [Clostridium sp. DJ247]|uniref:diaminopimelate decarboxylase family protein n=1 Tax=Clostridium sp. DJ247 TaxID=2726188 RepID=UPI00162A8B1C|nr:alanine racemase [Clostridium sp. DJ247]MBC2581088.1 decarboxylase [Clostridium sp. DJ247]
MDVFNKSVMEKDNELNLQAGTGYNDFIDTSKAEVVIGGYPLTWWIKNYGLPLHMNYEPIIRKNIVAFKNVFSSYYPEGKIRYAAKAYCHPSVFKIIKEEEIGVDVCSYNELRAALESGILTKEINLNGNSKEDFLIEQAIDLDILLTADSIEELELISKMALNMGKKASVLIRVSSFDTDSATDECILTSGVWTKFGVSSEVVKNLIMNLDIYPGLTLCGFHMHIGSQIANKEIFLYALGILIELGHMLKNNGYECKFLNIGGGFPLSYMSEVKWNDMLNRVKGGIVTAKNGDFSKLYVWNNESTGYTTDYNDIANFNEWKGEMFYSPYPKEKMLEAILRGIVVVNGKKINTVKALEELGRPEFLIEPGRSIVGDAGITLARVNNVKKIAFGHNLLVLEMGVVNYAGSVIHKLLNRWAIINDYNQVEDNPFEAFVCGNLCYNGDIIAKYKIQLQRTPKRGDVIAIYDTGGTESHFFASNANSYPCPSRILVDENGIITVTKRRQTYEDIFSI